MTGIKMFSIIIIQIKQNTSSSNCLYIYLKKAKILKTKVVTSSVFGVVLGLFSHRHLLRFRSPHNQILCSIPTHQTFSNVSILISLSFLTLPLFLSFSLFHNHNSLSLCFFLSLQWSPSSSQTPISFLPHPHAFFIPHLAGLRFPSTPLRIFFQKAVFLSAHALLPLSKNR